jgi:uncharacterized protein
MASRQNRSRATAPLTGIGLRGPHLSEVVAHRPAAPWFEVHPENYMGGGPAVAALLSLRRDVPIALHGVGLSLGSAEGLSQRHLARLKELALKVEPILVSEHLSWSHSGGVYLNDLLPLPYTQEALAVAVRNLNLAQEALGMRLHIENPSRYLNWRHSPLPEGEFLAELVQRTGCGLLCDVNNLYVTERNCGASAADWMAQVPADAVGEIHLAGHSSNEIADGVILIDDHGDHVAEPVWALFAEAARRFPDAPALIEWDTRLPAFSVLVAEAAAADLRRSSAVTGVGCDAQVA